jgi:hypothetical protein
VVDAGVATEVGWLVGGGVGWFVGMFVAPCVIDGPGVGRFVWGVAFIEAYWKLKVDELTTLLVWDCRLPYNIIEFYF